MRARDAYGRTAGALAERGRGARAADHRAFVAAAFDMKEKAVRAGDQPYGAVVVRNGEIVGWGPSRVRELGEWAGHAEREAMRDAQRRLARSDLSGLRDVFHLAARAAPASAPPRRRSSRACITARTPPMQERRDDRSCLHRGKRSVARPRASTRRCSARSATTALDMRGSTVGFGKKYSEFWLNARPEMAPRAGQRRLAHLPAGALDRTGRCLSCGGARERRHLRRPARPAPARRTERLLRGLHPRSWTATASRR